MKDIILKSLKTLFNDGDVIEFRIPKTQYDGTISGYFNNFEKLAEIATKYNGVVPAIYITINPVLPSLLARSNNRIKTKVQTTTGDIEITKRVWLPIDLDCQRPVGISSSEEEHNKAHGKAKEIIKFLKDKNWPEPIYADSGNGAHLLYKIDLPNDDTSRDLLAEFFKSLAYLVDTDLIHVDQTVFNAARIWKLYGTTAGKGDSLPDRPHRVSKILDIPDIIKTVCIENIKDIINMMPIFESPNTDEFKPINKFNLKAWMESHKIKVQNIKTDSNKTIYILEECPFNHDHRDAHIIEMNNGLLGFKCFRAGCIGHNSHWSGMREFLEPGYKNKKTKKIKKEKEEYKTNGAFNYIDRIIEKTPLYFDNAGQFWIWTEAGYYVAVDTTEILLNLLSNIADPAIIQHTFKSELLEAARLRGRDARVKDVPYNWIHTKSGVYDVKTGEVFEPTPEYLFTEPIPHKISKSEDTPTIDKLFNEWVSKDKIPLLYEIASYCLYNGYPIHRMFVFIGRGRNGKGQYRDLIVNLVGKNNRTASTLEQLINSRFETARLFNKKICTMGEINYTLLDRTAILKMLSGGDPIPGEMKNKSPFEFVNTAKLLINTNSLPQTADKTDAFYSRCIMVEFCNQFQLGKDIIETIPPKEYDNLLTKCLRILKELLDKGEFSNEGNIQDKEREYERLSNPLTQFINTYYDKDINGKVAAWRLMDKYLEYCTKNGFLKPHSKTNFNDMLKVYYDVEKENMFDEEMQKNVCWVWVKGIKPKILSNLSNLSEFPLYPLIRPLSENLDKIDKTDKTAINNSSLIPIQSNYNSSTVLDKKSTTDSIQIQDFGTRAKDWMAMNCKSITNETKVEASMWIAESIKANPSDVCRYLEKAYGLMPEEKK